MAKLAVLSLLSTAVVAQSGYSLVAEFSGASFFDNFDFVTVCPLLHFLIFYVDYQTAYDDGFISTDDSGVTYLEIDSTTVLNPNGVGRDSVKIVSKQSWTHGLVITDLNNMPGGVCGVYGRHYLAGPDAASGEIDIITGINNAAYNEMTLFSQPTCSVAGSGQTGHLQNADCSSSTGCSTIDDSDPLSYGVQFNNNGGGVFATQWTSDFIRVWFFPSGTTPDDITNGTPDPTLWGEPVANFQGSCNIDGSFANNNIVFDMDLCSSLVEANWAADGCNSMAATCREYVASFPDNFEHYNDFDEVYWGINAISVYQMAAVASSSSSSSSFAAATSLQIAATSSAPPSATMSSTTIPNSASSTILPAAVSSTTTTSPSPSSTGLGAYTYYGCVQELDYARILNELIFYNPAMTLEMCEADCAGYTYFGAEYGSECTFSLSSSHPLPLPSDSLLKPK
ncbi:hypothetical protein BDZ45DRAFT_650284 [Acephala macrosclerotiorum]|nr:hypothetical protein BDZ45DRAFT_650284 [Acephala macrosclerotiorum]